LKRNQFNIIHPGSGLKIDVIIPKEGPFDVGRFKRRKAVRAQDGMTIQYSFPEDIISSKLEFYREGGSEKHLRDIAGILKISGDELDDRYLTVTAHAKGLGEIWEEFKKRLRI